MNQALGWLLGLKNVETLRVGQPDLAASWAQGSGRFWVFFGVALLLFIAYFFYLKFQTRGGRAARFALATCRGLLLALVFIITTLISGVILDRMPFPQGYQIVFAIGFVGAMMSSLHLYLIRLPHEPTRTWPRTPTRRRAPTTRRHRGRRTKE